MSEYGEHMRLVRQSRGMTLWTLHRLTGIPFYLISNYENGKNLPGLQNLVKLSDALRVSLDTYVGHVPELEPGSAIHHGAGKDAAT